MAIVNSKGEANSIDEVNVMDDVIQQAIGLLKGFSEKEKLFALGVLKQIPERQINDDSYVCDFGYVHGEFNDESKEAFEECEEIIRQIEAGERVPRYSCFAEILAEIDEEIEEENYAKTAV